MTINTAQKSKMVAPENTLKKKVGSGGFDPVTLKSAQNLIENNAVDFRPAAKEFTASLADLVNKATETQCLDKDMMNEIMYPVMQLKAQGGLFHYPTISDASHIVIDFLENIPGLDTIVLEITDAYRKCINAIVAMQIKDPNSNHAKNICAELTGVCNRYYKLKNIR